MKPFHQLLYIVLVIVLSACNLLSSDSDKEINLKVEPLQESYILDKDTNITIRVKNVSSETIYSSDCNTGIVEELDGSKVSNALIYDNRCVCVCTFSVKPDEERELNIKGSRILVHDGFLFSTDVKYQINPYFYLDKELQTNISPHTYETSLVTLTK